MDSPSRLTSLALGAVTAAVVSAAVANSFITKGDVVFDTADNATPSIVVGTTDALTFSGSEIELDEITGAITSGSQSALCVRAVGTIGYCSSAIAADGECTCN